MKKSLSICLLVGSLAIGTSSFATAPAAPAAPADQAKAAVEQVEESVFQGVVQKHEDGAALVIGDKTYPLTGGDFGMIVGKEVSVTGKLVKEGDVEKLAVSKLDLDKQ